MNSWNPKIKQIGTVVFCLMVLLASCGCPQKSKFSSLTPAESHQAMLVQLEKIAQSSQSKNPYFGDSHLKDCQFQVERAGDSATTQMLFELGRAELDRGMVREAIGHFELALASAKDGDERERTRNQIFKTDVLYWLGVANLRLGEIENCCAQNSPDSCIVPIQGQGIHTRPEGSRNAIDYLQQVLQQTHMRSETHIRARWLLNIAYMTLGEYPDQVPKDFLVSPNFFKSTTARNERPIRR